MRISDWSSDVCSSDLGFCAGLDMASMAAGGSGLSARGRNADGAILPQHVTWGWRMLPMPVIAAVHGVAFGGGFQIMSGADIRIAAPTPPLAKIGRDACRGRGGQ